MQKHNRSGAISLDSASSPRRTRSNNSRIDQLLMWRIHLRVPKLEMEKPLRRPDKVCIHIHTQMTGEDAMEWWVSRGWRSVFAGKVQLIVNTELINTWGYMNSHKARQSNQNCDQEWNSPNWVLDGGSSAQEADWEETARNIRLPIKSSVTDSEGRSFQKGWSGK